MKSRLVVLTLLFCLTSCSYLTSQGRQEYAYRRYVRKSSVTRAKRQRKFKFRAPEMAIRENAPSMTVDPESPQSVTSSADAQQAAAPMSPPPPN